jgi:hypothetical protein
MFNGLHKGEIVAAPPELQGEVPDSIYRIVLTNPGSEQDVLMSRKYDQSTPDGYTQETTTIELRHTPRQ